MKGSAPLAIEDLVFESLAVPSLDEPFAKYGLLAQDIAVSEDKRSMLITLDKAARFSDGSPVLAEDVAFSIEKMKSPDVHPFYPTYYNDISHTEIIDERKIKVFFSRINKELPLIALDIPIFSKKFYEKEGNIFGKEIGINGMLGSGPYVIEKVIQGKTIVYKRNPNYWAVNKNVRKNIYNFDEIVVKYYKDHTVATEAFKAGDFDVKYVNIAKQWVRSFTGPKFDRKELIKKEFPHSNNAGMQCFVFNTRKKIFSDVRVRKALSMAFNYEWINDSMFFGLYTRNNSFFSNSYLAATGLPKGEELKYLAPFKTKLPSDVFESPLKNFQYLEKNDTRRHLKNAKKLLKEAGWSIKDGKLKNSEEEEFTFEILLASATFNRVIAPYAKNLERLGITVRYRVVDPALYTERITHFDFDMVTHIFGQSQYPGNEQRNMWHSEMVNVPGSGNVAGIHSEVVDDLVNKLIYSKNRNELLGAVHALDRVLWYGYYVIPHWHTPTHRLVYSAALKYPETLPLYYNYFQFLMTWWVE